VLQSRSTMGTAAGGSWRTKPPCNCWPKLDWCDWMPMDGFVAPDGTIFGGVGLWFHSSTSHTRLGAYLQQRVWVSQKDFLPSFVYTNLDGGRVFPQCRHAFPGAWHIRLVRAGDETNFRMALVQPFRLPGMWLRRW